MLNLKDGTLWQWDIGRKMVITLEEGSVIDKVQFYNGIGDNAYPATSIEVVDGEILAGIPNSLLCYANNLTVYLMTTDEDGVKTQEQITLAVNKRAKPEDYIFTDDEFHTYKVYDERLKYLEENVVLPDRLKESTDTEVKALVPEWAREAKPDTTLSQKGKAADAAVIGSSISDLQSKSDSLGKEIAVERARINNLTKAEESGLSTDAERELADVRVGIDGTEYDSAGEAVRGQIGNLGEETKKVTCQERILFTTGGNIKTNYDIGTVVDLTPEEISGWRHAIVSCIEGDKFEITGNGGVNPRLWAFLDSDNVLLSCSEGGCVGNRLVIEAPINAVTLIINDNNSGSICYKGEHRIDRIDDDVSFIGLDALRVKQSAELVLGKSITVPIMPGSWSFDIHLIKGCQYQLTNMLLSKNETTFNLFNKDGEEVQKLGRSGGGTVMSFVATDHITRCAGTSTEIGSLVISLVEDGIAQTIYNLRGTALLEGEMQGNIKTGLEIGSVVDIDTPESILNYRHVIIDCEPGDKFTVVGCGGVNPRFWAFLDSNNILLSVSDVSYEKILAQVITAPPDASKLVCNFNTYVGEHALYKGTDNFYALRMEMNALQKDDTERLFEVPDATMGAFIRGIKFADELKSPIMDFKKSGDKMVHVATVIIINGIAYATYYVNTRSYGETPTEHTARFAYAPLGTPSEMVYIDLQDVGETFNGGTVTAVYDTILLTKDNDTLYLMWTAAIDGVYYRLYKTYTISTKVLSETKVNYFKVGENVVDFCTTGMYEALAKRGIAHKPITIDIGIMQKLSTRVEDGITYYYTGCYANEFNCIIKSTDLITWEFVALPDFENKSQFENATYVIGDKCFYFVRQYWNENTGFLTYYDLANGVWAEPVYINDTQSRSDFFEYGGHLYLVHAPNDRNHISITRINQTHLNKSLEVQTAKVPDYFYPFVTEYNGQMYMAFTASRAHIYLSKFTMDAMTDDAIIGKFRELFW